MTTESTESSKWNPRYVAYATEHGRTPEEQRAHDREAFPGGPAVGFILWISQKWQAWKKAHGRGTWDPLFEEDHKSFDQEIGAR